jgi:hypothetical protein
MIQQRFHCLVLSFVNTFKKENKKIVTPKLIRRNKSKKVSKPLLLQWIT